MANRILGDDLKRAQTLSRMPIIDGIMGGRLGTVVFKKSNAKTTRAPASERESVNPPPPATPVVPNSPAKPVPQTTCQVPEPRRKRAQRKQSRPARLRQAGIINLGTAQEMLSLLRELAASVRTLEAKLDHILARLPRNTQKL